MSTQFIGVPHSRPVTLHTLFGGTQAAIIDALGDGDWCSPQEIAAETGFDPDEVRNKLVTLERFGVIRRAVSGGKPEVRVKDDVLDITVGELARGELQ